MTFPRANLSHSQPSEMWKSTPNDWSCDTVLAVWYYIRIRPIPFIRNWLWSTPFLWKASCICVKIHRMSVNFLETQVTLCLVQLYDLLVRRVISEDMFPFQFYHGAAKEPQTGDHICPYLCNPHILRLQALLSGFGLQVVVSCGVCTGSSTLGSLSHMVSVGITIVWTSSTNILAVGRNMLVWCVLRRIKRKLLPLAQKCE